MLQLLWVKTYQKQLRADLYRGLADAVVNGETDVVSTGKIVILPSSFTGGHRYMIGNYQDVMAICVQLFAFSWVPTVIYHIHLQPSLS